MKPGNASINKITRPVLPNVYLRKRLFSLLDKSRRGPVTWVSGPPGSGKTALAASYLTARKLPCIWYQVDQGDADISTFFYYMGLAVKKAAPRYQKPLPLLTPEYLLGITTFSRRYFEELYSRVIPPGPPLAKGGEGGFVLVFDNYQDVPADSPFHEIMRDGLSTIPEGIQVIIVSRSEPPVALVGLRAQDKMGFIGWDEIRFTFEETRTFVLDRKQVTLATDAIRRLHEKTTGWAAGLVLLMERHKTGPELAHLDTLNPEEIFDYFAGEIFTGLDSETKDFLLVSSFFPRMTAQIAGELTGSDDSGRILSGLSRNNFFTEKHSAAGPVYQYHPLFREFLQGRIKAALSREGVVRLQRKAAELLENSGQLEDAAHLFREARDWERLARLALAHAPILTAQGRNKTLEEWLSAIPAEILERNPLLLYWLGVCRIPYDLHESRAHFERAYTLFNTQQDAAGLYLSWSGVVETYILERSGFVPIDHWISEIERLLRKHPEFPSPEIKIRVTAMIFFAMMYRQPNHPDFRLWEERLLTVLPEVEDVGLRTLLSSHLVFYYSWWSGELAKAELLIKDLRNSLSRLSEIHPFAYIVFRSNEAAHFMVTGRSDLSQEAVEDALRTAEATGIGVWDFMLCLFGAHNALSDGDFEKARRFLDRAGRVGNNMRHLEVSHYHFQLAWESLCLGNPNVAFEHVKTAINTCIESGAPFLEGACKTGLAEVFHELGRHEEALKVLEEARAIGRSCNSKTIEFQALLIQTRIFLRLGKAGSATESLRGHLKIGRECGIYSTPWWRPSVMVGIYSKALEEGIETDYVREIIRRRGLVPETPPVHIEHWPWPIRIYTLGRFEIMRDDKPSGFSGKVQKKPFELLKALISLRGRGADQDHVADMLWPEAEGDAARNSMKMAVSRLRKLLGSESMMVVRDGRIGLDRSAIWIDAWAFEQMLESSEFPRSGRGKAPFQSSELKDKNKKNANGSPQSEIIELAQKAMSLYKGPFLPGDTNLSWTIPVREQLRGRFLRIMKAAGDRLWAVGQFETCLEFYHKAVEVDPLAEEFYQGLILCQHKLGKTTEAVMTYQWCKSVLAGAFGIKPSPRTEEIVKSIPGNNPAQ